MRLVEQVTVTCRVTCPDWFLLTIHGLDANGKKEKTVEFYLADFRAEDNGKEYIIEDSTRVYLSSLSSITGLQFTLSSSDNGQYGMNTPAYFAIDTLLRVAPQSSPPFFFLRLLTPMQSPGHDIKICTT